MDIVFFGSSPLSVVVLEKLVNSDKCSVFGVVTKEDKPACRGQKLAPNPVKVLAEKYGIKVQTSVKKLEGIDHNGGVGLVAAYGKIIPQSVLDKIPIYNIHPSLLPKYRGPSPLQQQILDGGTETGVTIIKLDAEMDHGPIVVQEKDTILPSDTWITLGERLFRKGADIFINDKRLMTNDKFQDQDHSQATYTKKITRQDGFVEWSDFAKKLNTDHLSLNSRLRAFAGWPGVWTVMPDGKRLKLISLSPEVTVQIEGKGPVLWKSLIF